MALHCCPNGSARPRPRSERSSRAQNFSPSVVLFDEIDSIAPSRSAESAQHQVTVVAQLLVLPDGIETGSQIFMLATTNRPEHVDSALRRPGRLDQVVWMRLPDERGRADIFEHYLRGLKLDPRSLRPSTVGPAALPRHSAGDIGPAGRSACLLARHL
ncbi:MAG: ATP-binding protein [Polyangia bacterium]|jgi:transitional endoplasmic reticulum ATPase